MERQYKDSGIEWIGRIPRDWNTTKLGALYTQRNEKVSDKDFPPLSVTMQGILPQLETAAKTDDGDNRKLVKKGDFAINSRSDRRGSCGISPYDGSVSLINTILKPRGEMNPKFYNWLFHTSLFADEFYKWGHGIVDDLWTTRWQEMKNISVAVPPLVEQQRISEYLDAKCMEIDKLIALQDQMIAQLLDYKQSVITEAVIKGMNPNVHMRDSGIDWIGEIPEHWVLERKLSHICNKGISYGIIKLFDPDDVNGVKVLRCSDVLEGYINEEKIRTVTKELSQEYKRTILSGGEIVINVRGTLGGCAVVPNSMRGYNIAREVALVDTKGINNYYLMYFFLSNAFHNYRNRYLAGCIYLGLNIEMLSSCPVIMPPLEEQQSIAHYLDTKCSEIDALINIKRQKIEMLKEYKKSIICEAVTGKTDLRDSSWTSQAT